MNQILQQLVYLTNAYNQLINQARAIFQLPPQTPLVTGSEIHVNNNGVSQKIVVQQIIDAALSVRQNQLLSIGTITVAGNNLTIPAGATWLINNTNYSNPSNIVINVPYAEDGNTRTDIIVADELNNIYRVNGPETGGVSPAPNVPLNTVLVTTVNVTDDSINETPAVPGVEYNSDDIENVSNVDGATTSDALNTLKTSVDSKLNKSDYYNQSEKYSTVNASSTIPPTPSVYDAFPLMVKSVSGKVILFSRNAFNHGSSDGILQMRTSNDGGFTFLSPITILSESGVDIRNVSGGVTSSGRIVLQILKYNSTSLTSISMGYIYSDDEGLNWTNYATLSTLSETGYSPYGKLISIGNNEIFQSWYGATGSTYSLYIRKSLDNGVTWQPSILVATSPTVNYSEASFSYLGGSTILAVCRASSPNVFVQFKSVDNGVTWSNMGSVSFESGFQVSPELSVFTDSNNEKWINLFYANRISNTLNVVSGKASNLLLNASGWEVSSNTVLDSNPNIDFGYPSVVSTGLSKFYNLAYYKASVPNGLASIYFKTGTTFPYSITGIGTANNVVKFNSNKTISNSNIIDNGTNVWVNSNIAFGLSKLNLSRIGSGRLIEINREDAVITLGITNVSGLSLSTVPFANGSGGVFGSNLIGGIANPLESTGLRAQTVPLSDTGTEPIIKLEASGSSTNGFSGITTVANRPVLGVYNFLTRLFSIGANGSLNISNAPTTSAGTYDILTRNTSTGVVEKLSSSALPTSGTYTPTISSQINTSSSTVTNASYYRVGSVVTVTLYGTLNLTSANTYSSFTISLPINRATSSSYPMGLSMLRNTNVFCNGWVTSSLTSETTIVFNLTPSTGGSTFTANFTYNVNN